MSKVFDSLRVAQKTRGDVQSEEPQRRDNIIPMGPVNLDYWTPEAPASQASHANKFYISVIIVLAAAIVILGAYALAPLVRVGRGGENPADKRQDDIELAIKNKLKTANSTSPTDPVNLANFPFEPVSDSTYDDIRRMRALAEAAQFLTIR